MKRFMGKINEILTSIIVYCLISYLLNLNHLEIGLIFAILGSQINVFLPKNYKHTLLLYGILLPVSIQYPILSIGLMAGYSSSILITLLSKNPCKLLYPLKSTTFAGPNNYLENDTKKDHAATTFLLTLVVISLMFSFNGTQILEKLNYEEFSSYSENNVSNPKHSTHYININPSQSVNKNITTITSENSTTTLITNYSPPDAA